MAVSPTNKTDTEKLFIILILFLGLVIAYLLAVNTNVSTSSQPVAVAREISPELRSANLDFSILDNILFKQLKVFGIIPVNPGQTGRANPFAPF